MLVTRWNRYAVRAALTDAADGLPADNDVRGDQGSRPPNEQQRPTERPGDTTAKRRTWVAATGSPGNRSWKRVGFDSRTDERLGRPSE